MGDISVSSKSCWQHWKGSRVKFFCDFNNCWLELHYVLYLNVCSVPKCMVDSGYFDFAKILQLIQNNPGMALTVVSYVNHIHLGTNYTLQWS